MAGRDIVICDIHHASLFQSLLYLFEKRLGFEVCRPFGRDWWEEGYVRYPHETDASGPTELATTAILGPSEAESLDPDKIFTSSQKMGRTITLEEAKDRSDEIKYMVASLYATEESFAHFIADCCSRKTILVRQVGNPNEPVRYTRHALCSDTWTYDRIKDSHHAILYHQEFSTDIFKYVPIDLSRKQKNIKTYVNYIHDNRQLRLWYRQFKQLVSSDKIKCWEHGMHGEDGEFHDLREIAKSMATADLVLSPKNWDGFGHCVHNAYAIGRPVISRVGDYAGKIAEVLMEDMVSSVLLTGDWKRDKQKVEYALRDEILPVMCWNARNMFELHVNFDEEEKAIRAWLSEI